MRKQINKEFTQVGITTIVILLLEVVFYLARLPLIIPLLFLFLVMQLTFLKNANVKLFLNMGLLLALVLVTARGFIFYHISALYIPVAAVSMLVVLLYNDLHLVFLMSFISSVMVGLIFGGDFNIMLVFFLGGLTAAYFVKDARTRGKIIETGFFVSVIQSICAILLNLHGDFILTKSFATAYLKPLLMNGFIVAAVVTGTSKVFEWLFGTLSNFSLLELSDFNHPLLKKMVLEAPGTYHHSIVVSNIAEAAADAIGANALLTRVGAYYHDIGKMVKPEYFTENQLVEGSKHDNLEPTMSRLVILNHVKEGIELAKQNKLNEKIIDFIPQHHGTSLIHYFYQRALEDAQQNEPIDEQNFRYPGPKPQSRETAIVMLADSVEGAVRALDEPTPSRIDETVKKVINNKFIDGQLDDCTLTLRDLDRISATFSRVLSAMYHSRVKYPEKKNGNGHNDNKPSEANSDQLQPNNQSRKKNP